MFGRVLSAFTSNLRVKLRSPLTVFRNSFLRLSQRALVSTHLYLRSLGRVNAEERGFGEGLLAGACPMELPMDPSPKTRKLISDPPEGG